MFVYSLYNDNKSRSESSFNILNYNSNKRFKFVMIPITGLAYMLY